MENKQRPCQLVPDQTDQRLASPSYGPWLGTEAKPKADQGQKEKTDTYVAQVSDNLPHPSFIQLGEGPAVLPKEMSEVAKLAQLGLDVQSVILFPAIDVRQHVWVPRAWAICHRIRAGQMMENLDLLT
jgi:hypothetical protein